MPYIGKAPQQGIRNRFIYSATAGQTSFTGSDANALTLSYPDGEYVDVYQNGVLLKPATDYTSTSGTSVVLVTGASVNDVIEIIVYDTFSIANSYTKAEADSRYLNVAGDTMTGSLVISDGLTLTDGDLVVASGHGISFAADSTSSVTGVTNTSEVLHDYEEGTFTPLCDFATDSPTAGKTQGNGQYTKIGRQVFLHFKFTNINVSGASGDIQIEQIPFVPTPDSGDGAVGSFTGSARGNHINFASSSFLNSQILDGASTAKIVECIDNATSDTITAANCSDGTTDIQCTLSFTTAS